MLTVNCDRSPTRIFAIFAGSLQDHVARKRTQHAVDALIYTALYVSRRHRKREREREKKRSHSGDSACGVIIRRELRWTTKEKKGAKVAADEGRGSKRPRESEQVPPSGKEVAFGFQTGFMTAVEEN